MLRMGEQHSDKRNVDGDEKSMETIAPTAKRAIAPSCRVILSIVVEKCCDTHLISTIMMRCVTERDAHFRWKGLVPILW